MAIMVTFFKYFFPNYNFSLVWFCRRQEIACYFIRSSRKHFKSCGFWKLINYWQQFRKATFAERAEPPLKQIPLQFLTLIRTFYLSKLLPSLSFSYRSCEADWLNKTTNFLKWDLWTLISLRKIPKFYLFSWCENFVERRSFRIVSFARNYEETVSFHKISKPGY